MQHLLRLKILSKFVAATKEISVLLKLNFSRRLISSFYKSEKSRYCIESEKQ